MTIKEVEERTGLARSNIRFYEKEKLLQPSRNDKNGYRDYSEQDVKDIKKIAYLRTLGISVDDIRHIRAEKVSLMEVLEKQNVMLREQLEDLSKAQIICERMLEAGNVSFDELQIEKYVTDLQNYWSTNKTVFTLDSVDFLYIWRGLATWIMITALCFIIAIMSYAKLPSEIPVQWSEGAVTSQVDRKFIFVYPLVCIALRILARPFLYVRLAVYNPFGELIAEYLSNYMCFLVLSVEVFSILYLYGLAKSILAVLAVDTAVLIGILMVGIYKMDLQVKWRMNTHGKL